MNNFLCFKNEKKGINFKKMEETWIEKAKYDE